LTNQPGGVVDAEQLMCLRTKPRRCTTCSQAAYGPQAQVGAVGFLRHKIAYLSACASIFRLSLWQQMLRKIYLDTIVGQLPPLTEFVAFWVITTISALRSC